MQPRHAKAVINKEQKVSKTFNRGHMTRTLNIRVD